MKKILCSMALIMVSHAYAASNHGDILVDEVSKSAKGTVHEVIAGHGADYEAKGCGLRISIDREYGGIFFDISAESSSSVFALMAPMGTQKKSRAADFRPIYPIALSDLPLKDGFKKTVQDLEFEAELRVVYKAGVLSFTSVSRDAASVGSVDKAEIVVDPNLRAVTKMTVSRILKNSPAARRVERDLDSTVEKGRIVCEF